MPETELKRQPALSKAPGSGDKPPFERVIRIEKIGKRSEFVVSAYEWHFLRAVEEAIPIVRRKHT